MSTNKPVRTITATCACGATFSREVKRGRPQKWCPSCVTVSFYERLTTPTPFVAVIANDEFSDAVAALIAERKEAAPERIVNENDDLDAVRAEIEAEMALINLDHKARYAALVAGGMSVFDAADKAQAVTLAATQNLYALHAPSKYKPGREIDDV